jgi:LuxR family maltose regulon positive regulatory protein
VAGRGGHHRRGAEAGLRLYRQAGDWRAAARLATWLAWDAMSFRGELAVANGWLQRRYRLLDGHDQVPERGWLLLRDGEIRLLHGHDTRAARRLAAEAVALGRALGELDVEMVGLALEGLALVSEGGWPRACAGWTRPRPRRPAGSWTT